MSQPTRPPLALTMGDPGGVGAEITISAWQALRETGPAFFLIDDFARIKSQTPDAILITDPMQASEAFTQGLPL